MKLNPDRYEAYLTMPLDQYCATRIEPVRTEIDEVGLQALVDGVIKVSGIGVEILYLDRSEGEHVTPHILTDSRPSQATIRLLYRPWVISLSFLRFSSSLSFFQFSLSNEPCWHTIVATMTSSTEPNLLWIWHPWSTSNTICLLTLRLGIKVLSTSTSVLIWCQSQT